jgi:hypothetical protein
VIFATILLIAGFGLFAHFVSLGRTQQDGAASLDGLVDSDDWCPEDDELIRTD